ncbi:MAG: methyl-accepting chemotaxis protein [Clostridia bacterium]|jgi:methyl-accepting chemotaxis protein|nr:methyl-accepting chemotaxis protein [Clostridia bacterium]
MKLQYKLTLPIIITILVSFTALTVTSYLFANSLINENIETMTVSKLDEAEKSLNDSLNEAASLKEELNNQYISKAKTFSLMIQQNPGIINDTAGLEELAKTMDVEELHVTDEEGIIRWGTVKEFYGFDFKTSDQTKVFIPALTDKNFTMAQDPSIRGTDKALFQYISVARLDKPGVVQIGVKPERLQKALESTDIKTITESITFGKEGIIFLIDKNNDTILTHREKSMIGKNANEYDFFRDVKGKESGVIKYTIGGVKKTLSYKVIGDYYLCSTIPDSEFNSGLKRLTLSSFAIAAAALLVSAIIIDLLIRFNVINELNKVLAVLVDVGKGNLKNRISTKSSKELSQLSDGINGMLESLRDTMSKNIALTASLADVSEKLSVSADQSSRAADEVAATVNELAQGAGEQAENSTQGAMQAREALTKLEAISRDIVTAVDNTGSANKAVENGMQSIEKQSDSMLKNVQSVKTVSNTINELAAKAEEIGNIVSVITGIASQTNMLALNAAIEAARAGDAGKGFAVVADEVRKLAENSTASAQQIAEIISVVQQNIENAKTQANESILMVEHQQQSLVQTKNSFDEISGATTDTLRQINNIKSSTDNIVRAVDYMIQGIEASAASAQQSAAGTEEISASTEEQSATMEEIAQIAKELNGMVDELNALTQGFKI